MKSAFVKHLSEILRHVSHCSFVSCIGVSCDHIHQGHIITIRYHPVIYEALLQVLQTDHSSLGPKENYMMYCRQMYGIIKRELVCDDKKISCGENITARWGSIHLFQEKYNTPGLVSTIDRRRQISCDGHKSFMKNDPHPVFVIRCLKWVGTMKKKRRINIRHIHTVSDIE